MWHLTLPSSSCDALFNARNTRLDCYLSFLRISLLCQRRYDDIVVVEKKAKKFVRLCHHPLVSSVVGFLSVPLPEPSFQLSPFRDRHQPRRRICRRLCAKLRHRVLSSPSVKCPIGQSEPPLFHRPFSVAVILLDCRFPPFFR
jgi:hypothetical protein